MRPSAHALQSMARLLEPHSQSVAERWREGLSTLAEPPEPDAPAFPACPPLPPPAAPSTPPSPPLVELQPIIIKTKLPPHSRAVRIELLLLPSGSVSWFHACLGARARSRG